MRYTVKNMGDGWYGVVDTKTNRVAEYRRGEREAQEVADRMNAHGDALRPANRTAEGRAMKSEITVTLRGDAGVAILRQIAEQFAALTIKSRLDGTPMWNAPWHPAGYRAWMKAIECRRIAYRDILRSTGLDLPAPPQVTWPTEQMPARDGKRHPSYSGPRVVAASKAWADAFLAPLLAKEVA